MIEDHLDERRSEYIRILKSLSTEYIKNRLRHVEADPFRHLSTQASLGDFSQSGALSQFLVTDVHVEDLLPALHVRQAHGHATIKSPWPQQGVVQDVRTIGRCHHDDTAVAFEAIHFSQDPQYDPGTSRNPGTVFRGLEDFLSAISPEQDRKSRDKYCNVAAKYLPTFEISCCAFPSAALVASYVASKAVEDSKKWFWNQEDGYVRWYKSCQDFSKASDWGSAPAHHFHHPCQHLAVVQ